MTPCRPLGLLILSSALCACVSYQPGVLPDGPDLSGSVPRLTIEKTKLVLPGMEPRPYDPSDGLDEFEVAVLALANNPLLKAERARVGIGEAQLFAVKLLPDPELGLALEHPTDNAARLSNGLGITLSYPLNELVARGATGDAATAHKQQLDLELVWQEWQVAQQARMLYARRIEQDTRFDLLQEYQRRLAKHYAGTQRLLQSGNLTLAGAAADLAALRNVNAELNTLERDINRTGGALLSLLGLDPNAKLTLTAHNSLVYLFDADIDAVLAALPNHRPDLLALKSGYESQDALLRKAVLEQFPGIGVGLNRGRDTDGLHTIGVGVTLRLPFLSGNRGAIAIEKATREQLWYVYQERLAQVHSEVKQLWNEKHLLERQLKQIQDNTSDLELELISTRKAFEKGNLDSLTYLAAEEGLLRQRLEAVELEENIKEVDIGLQTFTGLRSNVGGNLLR